MMTSDYPDPSFSGEGDDFMEKCSSQASILMEECINGV